MNYNELYNEFKGSGMSLSAYAKQRGIDKGNLSKAFKKLTTNTTGVVGVVEPNNNVVFEDTTDDNGVVNENYNVVNDNDNGCCNAVVDCSNCERIITLQAELETERESIKISNDCSDCSEKTELMQALLKINDLRTEVEELKTFPASGPAEVTEKVIEIEKDCSACEKLADMDRDRAEMAAEIDRLTVHKTNLMEKCDRLTSELETAKTAQGQSQGKEDVERLEAENKRIKITVSSLKSEITEREREIERLQSALSKLENENNSLKTGVEDGKAETERLQSVVESHKTEVEKINENAKIKIENIKNAMWNKKWNYVIAGIIAGGSALAAGMFTVIWIMRG